MSSLLIGLNTFNDLPFLRATLPALEKLRRDLRATVVLLDTAANDSVRDFVQRQYPQFDFVRHPEGNIGYGRSCNEILRRFPDHEFFLMVTSDVLLEPDRVKLFVKRMQDDPELIMAAGKLYHWDFLHKRKTRVIDSLGIVGEQRHHFYDRGAGEQDRGQYDGELWNCLGISGAVFLFRMSFLPRLQRHGGLFDERMWMYKEDVDLAYRLRWLGAKIAIFPEVWGWHARTVANHEGQAFSAIAKADQGKRNYARFHSYKNHLLLLKNNFTFAYGMKVFLRVLIYEIVKAIYMLFRSPKAFSAGLYTLLFVPSKRSPRQIRPQGMLAYFK